MPQSFLRSFCLPLFVPRFASKPCHGAIFLLSMALLAALRPLPAEDLGHEFRDIRLGRAVLARHPSLGPVREGESPLPSLKSLEAILGSKEVEPVVFLELYRDDNDRYAPLWSADGRHIAFIRADLEKKTSKIDLMTDLATGQLKTPFLDQDSYDYMPAWAKGHTVCHGLLANRGTDDRARTVDFCFASTAGPEQTMEIYFSGLDLRPVRLTKSRELKKHPDLCAMPDGGLRLVFEKEGEILWGRLGKDGALSNVTSLGEGTYAEWSPDGERVAFVQPKASGEGTSYALTVLWLGQAGTAPVVQPQPQPLRSPTWSPDGKFVAFYVAGEKKGQYDLAVVPAVATRPASPIQTLATDVVVESNFDHVGPAWTPDSRGIFFFGRQGEDGVKTVEESYYRLLYKSVDGKQPLRALDYDSHFTTAIAPHVNPAHPEVVFAATRGLSQGIYVLVLNQLTAE